jgi:serine/threonine-protein kinase
MAPEQAWGEQVDRRADVFALGVMLWEAITGRRLWRESEGNVLQRLVNGKIPTARSVAPDVNEHLERIAMKALALDREARYPTAAAMRAELQEALEELGRPDEDALSRLMHELFRDDQAAIRAVIEEQLRRVDQSEPIEPVASLPSLEQVGSLSASGPISASPSSSTDPTRATKVESRSVTLSTRARAQRPARRGRNVVAAVVVGGAIVAGLAGGLTRRKGSAPEGARPTQSAAEDAAAAAVTKMVSVQVVAAPPEARLLLDGRPLATNPYAGSLPADGAEHEIRAEAPGYLPAARRVTFSGDVSTVLRLEGVDAGANAAGAPPGRSAVSAGGNRRPAGTVGGGTTTTATTPTSTAAPPGSAPGAMDWKDPWK